MEWQYVHPIDKFVIDSNLIQKFVDQIPKCIFREFTFDTNNISDGTFAVSSGNIKLGYVNLKNNTLYIDVNTDIALANKLSKLITSFSEIAIGLYK